VIGRLPAPLHVPRVTQFREIRLPAAGLYRPVAYMEWDANNRRPARQRRRRGTGLIKFVVVLALVGTAVFFGMRKKRQADAAAATAAVDAAKASEAQFRASHKLTGVSIFQDSRAAIIDGKAMAVGQSVGGRTLIEVTERTATFRAPDGDIVLTLPQQKVLGKVAPAKVSPQASAKSGGRVATSR
jgi:hypothetical protein